MNKLILFGAGVYAKKFKALLEYLEVDFDYFTDNDENKWGKFLYGKQIISPKELKKFKKCRIIISCIHEISIKEQLKKMGLQNNIIGMEELYVLCEKKQYVHTNKSIQKNSRPMAIIDMYEGIGWGGTELWAAELAKLLSERKINTILIGGVDQIPLGEEYEKLINRMPEYNTIMHMVNLFEDNLPCTFINNFAGCAFMAANIVKRRYPDKIKIISVIHSDNKALFDAHMYMSKYIDSIFCVSNQIKNNMQNLYSYDCTKYYFKEQPISTNNYDISEKEVSTVIKIGYAGRLVKQHKRADLLINLIQGLEKEEINYFLQIAGEGECFEPIQNYIQENNLDKKVCLWGRIEKKQMPDFWKKTNVFVNISECEGTSLSMLEAMSYCCAPVVTDVSGAKEFISHGENGYICEIGNLCQLVKYIRILSNDLDKLKEFGKKSREIVVKKCDTKQYIEYWINNLLL
ncbi:MAG: glycosyltransferase family 4 protein [Lachnospiraceae bacterium]|nr:glycosyltransferase family 4 protein [Lachnospiraceae bacterium]